MSKSRYLFFCILFFIFLSISGCGKAGTRVTLRAAMPYSVNVIKPSDNYYIKWLEKETGYDIEPVIIRQKSGEEYLANLFDPDSQSDIDIVMFGEGFEVKEDVLTSYRDKGYIYTGTDDRFYFPNYGSEAAGDCAQIMWINTKWLEDLGLRMPQSTDDLLEVLRAFKENDPNGNGLQDEIPLLSCEDDYAYCAYEYILESYIYNDPYHNRMYMDDAGSRADALCSEQFREGMIFCGELKAEGLMNVEDDDFDLQAMAELINSPEDIVGAFTSDSLSEVIYNGNPEVMARYVHVPPLLGPHGEVNALHADKKPAVGAIICAGSYHTAEAERLLELMLSKEASLIAKYGQEGVDWDYSEGVDVSIYGTPSTIVTHKFIWNIPQNEHLNGIGPMNVPGEYLKGVTWNGVNSDSEYIDARAQMAYAQYIPELTCDEIYDSVFSNYTDSCLYDFVVGRRHADSDIQWKEFTDKVKNIRGND